MNYIQSCFLFDYGNRKPAKDVLEYVCDIYKHLSTEIGFIFFVNNNPYNLEFYFILEVEKEFIDEFNNIKKILQPYSIKELSILTTQTLLTQMAGRRFNSCSIPASKLYIEKAFRLFEIKERRELKSIGYNLESPRFYPDTIFFSYSNKNLIPTFDNVIAKLNANSFPIFFDRKSLFSSEHIDKNIEYAIKDCHSLVFFIDIEFIKSDYCLRELELAKQYNKKYFLVIDKKMKFEHNNLFTEIDIENIDNDLLYNKIKEFIFSFKG